ncbi:MAG TPA: hypothetical protein VKS25_14980, partial [Solirubrobacteraceae bacterium]|nr:hypothetical protein [Solirubrobacteraceae bacterium]
FAGQYLRVADQTYGPGTAFADQAFGSPYGPSVWPPGPTTAVAIVGRIGRSNGPSTASCAVPLSITVSARGVATIPSEFASTTATLRATLGTAHQRVTRTLGAGASSTLRLSPIQLRRLGHGTATFEVLIDGIPELFRLVHLGSNTR